MSDELYYPFRTKWLGKWHTARYLCTLAELEERFGPGGYEIVGPGKRHTPDYAALHVLAFNIKAPILDIDNTGGDEPVYTPKLLMLEWDEQNVTYVLVPLDVFEPYKDVLGAGVFVSITGNLHEVPGGKWHVATSLRISGKKH